MSNTLISAQEYISNFVNQVNKSYPEFFLRYEYVEGVRIHIIFNPIVSIDVLIDTLSESEQQVLLDFINLYPGEKLVFSDIDSPLDLLEDARS